MLTLSKIVVVVVVVVVVAAFYDLCWTCNAQSAEQIA